jgi:hypothetical protein
MKNVLKLLVAKPVEKRSLVELKRSLEEDRTNLTEVRYMCVDWILLAPNGIQ